MEIEKISNVQIQITDSVLKRQWNEVINKRNRLLAISDWTQLPDTELPKSSLNLWVRWRKKLRNVKKSTINNPQKAMEILNSLESQMPEKLTYIENITMVESPNIEIDNIETTDIETQLNSFKKEIASKFISMQDIENTINDRISSNTTNIVDFLLSSVDKKLESVNHKLVLSEDMDIAKNELIALVNKKYHENYSTYTEVDTEKFQQSVDYLIDDSPDVNNYPLLNLESTIKNISKKGIATRIINERKVWLQRICKLEEERLYYIDRIEYCETNEELSNIINEIT